MPLASPSRSSRFDRFLLAAISLGGIAALCVPEAFLRLSPPCLITLATGHPCWGCGMTRAVVAALRLDLAAAWRWNPAVAVVLPLLAGLTLRFAWRVLRRR